MTNFFRRVFAPSPPPGDCSRHRLPARSRGFVSAKAGGFTLIEMSVVLAIASALTAGALGAYKVMIAEQYLKTTKDRMAQIQRAMVRFQSDAINNPNQHLPCPAPLHAAPGTAAFGVEDVDTAASLNCSTTVLGTAPHDDTFRASDGPVRVGGVPWKTLGIPMQTAYDAWGHRFLYAVSENLADPDPAPAYNAADGVITIKGPSTSGTPLPDKAPFVLISLGKSGFGSVTPDGKNFPIACPTPKNTPGGPPEADNCDWATPDATFGERTYSEAGSPNSHFDDYIVHTLDNIVSTDAAGANYIDKLDDGISDWPFNLITPSNVFLGNNSGLAMDYTLTPQPNNISGGNTSAGIGNFTYNFPCTFPQSCRKSFGSTALGMEALSFNNANYNTASGYQALYHNYRNVFVMNDNYGYNNTATGAFALWSNLLGWENTATGVFALYNNNSYSSENTATGVAALMSNTSGMFNTATGMYAMGANTTGANNTAFGIQALYANMGKSGATAIGAQALYYADNGAAVCNTGDVPPVCNSNNTAAGYQALYGSGTPSDNTGINNTAIGAQALYSNTSGQSNTAAGMQALFYNQAKSGSTAVGYQALYFADDTTTATDSRNTAVGHQALGGILGSAANNGGTNNTAVGSHTLYLNSSGSDNTAAGNFAQAQNQTGSDNTSVGIQTLYANKTKSGITAVGAYAMRYSDWGITGGSTQNTAVGYMALPGNSASPNIGQANTAVGAETLYTNISGNANTALGGEALYVSSVAHHNTAIGYQALYYADDTTTTTDTNNTGVGYQAMYQNTGVENTAVGSTALSAATPVSHNTAAGYGAGVPGSYSPGGDYNTFIGYQAGPLGDWPLSNITVIGANAANPYIDTSFIGNTVLIGDGSVTDVYFGTTGGGGGPGGDTNPFTGTGIATVHAGPYNSPSDLRLKKDIRDSDLGLDFIEKLRPVSYFYKTGGNPMSYGFIAQEVEKALGGRATSMVTQKNDKMKTYELNYSEIISPLVRAVQEFVMNMLNVLEKTVADLGARFSPVEQAVQKHQLSLAQQQEQLQSLLKSMSGMKGEMDALKAMLLLLQRIPEFIGLGDGGKIDVARLDAADMNLAVIENPPQQALIDRVARQLLDIDLLHRHLEKSALVNQPLGGKDDLRRPLLHHHRQQHEQADESARINRLPGILPHIAEKAVVDRIARRHAQHADEPGIQRKHPRKPRILDAALVRQQGLLHKTAWGVVHKGFFLQNPCDEHTPLPAKALQ
ncbi:MAG: tail fiber domain-containing protein [Alphaproteobacteria bacterium]|nr:tail fiber domain-containing protein [Alphaproteobacteria bacterium]